MPAPSERSRAARFAAIGLWVVLIVAFAAWAAFLWHPWIDWFGRPR